MVRKSEQMRHYENTDYIDENMKVKQGLERETIVRVTPSTQPVPLLVSCFGITEPCPTYHIKRTSCGYFIFEYVISGKGYIINNGEMFSVEAGDAYLLQPGSKHEYYADSQTPYKKYWINFRSDFFHDVLNAYHLENKTVFQQINLKESFEKLFALEQTETKNDDIYCEASAILFDMFMKIAQKEHQDKSHSELASRIQTMLLYAVTNPWSIEHIAHDLYISKSYLIREFKRSYGCTPHQYLLDKRIELAKQQLQNTQQSIQDISDSLCFSDSHYFSNLFKAKTGFTPTQYRQLNQPNSTSPILE
jgi:AraC-like DNA-binding protein